jgi:hypothetical protein
MKTLITLSVLQTVGIAALVFHAFGTKHSIDPEQRPSSSSVVQATSGAAPNLGEERLRAIIREEFAQLQSSVQGHASPAAAPTPRKPAIDADRREAVAQQIEIYRGVGAITDAQMQELQVEIAQLDGAGRKEMMSKLVRALNSGEIKGRL